MLRRTNQTGSMGWQDYFCLVSKSLKGQQVQIDVISERQPPMHCQSKIVSELAYDARKNELEIVCEDFEHVISDPVAVHLQADDEHINGFVLVQGDGTRHMLQFSELQHV